MYPQCLLTDFSLVGICCIDSCCLMAQVKKSYFEDIRARCLSAGVLYEDPAFPAVPESVYFSEFYLHKNKIHIQWRRPKVCYELTALLCIVQYAFAQQAAVQTCEEL